MAPVRRVWVLGFLLLTLAVVYGAFGYLYLSFRRQLDSELGQRLVAVATATAAAVNGETWTLLAAGDSAAAEDCRRELDEVRRTNNVSDIFLFFPDEVTLLDLANLYAQGRPNPALAFDVVAVTTALAGIPSATRLYVEEGTYLKSGYAPVLGPGGDVLGGVGVVASAGFLEVLGQVRRTLGVAAALVFAGVALLGMIFARLQRASARLEGRLRRSETLAAMGQMAAMLAHEIRNPLGIIRGAAERTGERYGIRDDEVFRFIPEEVDRLERTLGAYLDFARPGSGDEMQDLSETLARTIDLARHELEGKGIDIDLRLEEGRFPVQGDPLLLRQAFLNVILNARDAMPRGGRLSVGLERRGESAAVLFADTGEGMTEDVLRRAVEPFFTDKERGSGLGLAVVQRLADDLHGRLELESRPDEGTRVTITLPLGRARGENA
jgi:signal transduction histidine kinase